MRTKFAARNIVTVWGQKVLILLSSFLLRTIFIQKLGIQLVGIDSLFINILSMLSLSELGVGMAIQYSLYKPIEEKDHGKICSIMALFKTAYRWIAGIVLMLGLLVSLFLSSLVNEPPVGINITVVFFLFLLDVVLSYLYSYNRTFLVANQCGYKYNVIDSASKLVLFIGQIAVLILYPNYYLFLFLKISINLLENIYVSVYVGKIYPFLRDRAPVKLGEEEHGGIVQNIKALFFHKVGDFCINSTDNIIISAFMNVASVGLLSNYNLVLAGGTTFINSAFSELTASLGNLVVTENRQKKQEMVEVLNFIAFCVYGTMCAALYNLLNPFITLWLGEQYVLSEWTVGLLLFSLYLTGMRVPLSTFKTAAGIFKEDKWIPLIQSAVNLVFSLLLVKPYGIAGVIMGTILSSILVASWNRPYIVYKYALETNTTEYFKKFSLYLISIIAYTIIIRILFLYIFTDLNIASLIIKSLICLAIPSGITVLLYGKSEEFGTCWRLVRKTIGCNSNAA